MSDQTVPVFVDSMKQFDYFERTRCAYYRVEDTFGPIGWSNRLALHSLSRGGGRCIALWAGWAVLTGPDRRQRRGRLFTSVDLVTDTLNRIQEDDRYSLDVGHIWLPNLLFAKCKEEDLAGGNIFRISAELFRDCYLFTAEQMAENAWIETCTRQKAKIKLSRIETTVFRAWRHQQIEQASARYHSEEYSSRRLRKKEA